MPAMLDRLAGLETEYAIRFTPRPGGRPASNARVYAAVMRSVGGLVHLHSRRGIARGRDVEQGSVFVQNGGAFNYEALGTSPHGGLLEGATPECRGPTQLLLYQRAQEELLRRALPAAEEELALDGYPGEIGLLKNCRDAYGHLYGAQENYTVEIARGPALWALRAALLLGMPFVLLGAVTLWATLLVMLAGAVLLGLVFLLGHLIGILVPPLSRWLDRRFPTEPGPDPDRRTPVRFARAARAVDLIFSQATIAPLSWPARWLALGRVRRGTLAFFVSRPILSGAGTLVEGDEFALSEKGPGIRRVVRVDAHPDARGIFELPDVLKAGGGLVTMKPRALLRPFRRRQRLQLGLSDSNMAQVAEYLKIGTTLLVLDMLESGWLEDAPQLADPIASLHAVAADPGLRAELPLRGGGAMTALALQRHYHERAVAYLSAAEVVAMEARQVVRLWGQALDGLERDPGSLVGRLDWVTKRFLLESCDPGGAERTAALKKIDLRYHEISGGYFGRLEAELAGARLVSEADVERAMTAPPPETPAFVRGRLVAELADSDARVRVDWDQVRIGGPVRGQVIRLSDHRRPPR